MPDVVNQIESAATAPLSFAKRNPIGFAVVMILGVLVLLHFSGAINRWIAGRAATKPAGMWGKLGRWTGAVAAGVCMFLLVKDAVAAVHAHGLLTMGTGLLAMASAFGFPQPDYCALKDEQGNYTSLLTPGDQIVERKFILSAARETVNGFPLKITDIDWAARISIDNTDADTGGYILWDELFALVAGLEIASPRFGTICDKNFYTGPVAKHFGEFIGNGYAYSGDEAFATIATGAGGVYVLNLNISYPFMHRCLAKPEESAMFVGWLQATQLKFNLAPAATIGSIAAGSVLLAGAEVELRCGYRQFLSVGHGNPAQQFVVPPLFFRRTMLTPANGQFDVVFPQVSATGPQNTNVTNGERLVSAVLLSDNLGLPGPGTFERITEIGCQGLGILNTYNPDQQQKAKFAVERRINGTRTVSALGAPSRVGWPYTIQPFDELSVDEHSVLGSVLTPSLLGLAYALPGMQTKISKLPRVKGDLTVHALQPYAAAVPPPTPPATTPPASPAYPPAGAGRQYAMYLETARDIDGGYAAQLLAAAGVRAPVTRHVNHNADLAVAAGSARAAQYTGMPQGPKT
jgi:hypothetical protein